MWYNIEKAKNKKNICLAATYRMEETMKATIEDYGFGFYGKKVSEELYDGSAFTWEGLQLRDKVDAMEIAGSMEANGFAAKDEMVFYRTTGAYFNERYGLTGSNRYPDELTIVSIPLEYLNVADMLPVQLRFGARWFDDIVDNNARREEEKAA